MTTLQLGIPVTVGKFTLIPLEHLFIQTTTEGTHGWLAAYKKLHAIIICDSGVIWTLTLDAEPLSVEQLVQDVPELESVLASLGALKSK